MVVWICSLPPVSYLALVAASFQIIRLTQITQYLMALKVVGLTPGKMLEQFSGATGHSQSTVPAIAISALSAYVQFASNSKKALKWLFLAGSRAQVAFPVVSPQTKLDLKGLECHVAATNKCLPENSKLCISLHNNIKAFVRKLAFLIGIPFHSPYLTDTVDVLLNDDLEGGGALEGQQVTYPSLLHSGWSSASLITHSTTERIFTLPPHWTNAIDFPETATHAVDFGPGITNGVGPVVVMIVQFLGK
ncbi:hypothetical protein BDM02DRAFT_3193925 [Thelephora ganbajun]|uniref:Uncharacterized protein n=1 Tax=Thelephora ganbajun TaxID=370292 RepID=A0ACB6YXW8_THEGA|nr:hypothetical protein BDM02DRAFT_3193925 [Thelephora ganbajun]